MIPKSSPPSSPFRRICAWCHTDLGPLWPGSRAHSYGICPACLRRYFPDLYETDGTKAQPHEPQPRSEQRPEDIDERSAELGQAASLGASERD
jgi:hypothetical protein